MENILESSMSDFEHSNNIKNWLKQDAFEINGVMFSCKDVIQSVLYISPFCYAVLQNQYNPTNVNAFMITINPSDEVAVLTPGHQVRLRPSGEFAHSEYEMNTVMVHKVNKSISFSMTSGFLFDNFLFQTPKLENDGKYVLEETGDLVIFKHDLEKLMSVDF